MNGKEHWLVSSCPSHVWPLGSSGHGAERAEGGNPRQTARIQEDQPQPASQPPLRPLPPSHTSGPSLGRYPQQWGVPELPFPSGEGPGHLLCPGCPGCWLAYRQAGRLASGHSGNVNSTFASWIFLAPGAADLYGCCLGPFSLSSPPGSAGLAVRCWRLVDQQAGEGVCELWRGSCRDRPALLSSPSSGGASLYPNSASVGWLPPPVRIPSAPHCESLSEVWAA